MDTVELILIVIAIYCLLVGYYLLLCVLEVTKKIASNIHHTPPPAPSSSPHPSIDLDVLYEESIMGQSNWAMRHDKTFYDTKRDDVRTVEKPVIFVQTNKEQTSTEPSNSTSDRSNSHNVIVADIEAGYEETVEQEHLTDMGYDPNLQASGVELPDLQEAVKTVSKSSSTLKEKTRAGEIFFRIEGSDIANQLEEKDDAIAHRIKEVLSIHISNHERETRPEGSAKQLQLPLDFDLDSYF